MINDVTQLVSGKCGHAFVTICGERGAWSKKCDVTLTLK